MIGFDDLSMQTLNITWEEGDTWGIVEKRKDTFLVLCGEGNVGAKVDESNWVAYIFVVEVISLVNLSLNPVNAW